MSNKCKKDNINKRFYNIFLLILFVVIIISFILSFFIYIYVIPICVFGILISIFLRKKSNLYYLFIILFILCIIFSIILQIFFKPKPFNDLVGTWNCSFYDSSNLDINIKINNENKLLWSKYDDIENNYILGKYEIDKIDKVDKVDSVKYYKFTVISEKYIKDGINQDVKYKKIYEIAINNDEEKAVFISDDNNIFKCNKISKDNPVIK